MYFSPQELREHLLNDCSKCFEMMQSISEAADPNFEDGLDGLKMSENQQFLKPSSFC